MALPAAPFVALAGLVDTVLPRSCAGCDGTVPVASRPSICPRCRPVFETAPRRVRPDPLPAGLPPSWAVGPYAGPLRAALLAGKERGRAGVIPLLGELLGRSLVAAVGSRGGVIAVPVPASRTSLRSRRDDVVWRIARSAVRFGATAGSPVRLVPALHHVQAVRDQGDLTADERARNLRGALAVRRPWTAEIRGASVIVLDDVLTTGSTICESARALRQEGADVVAAAVVAATARRVPAGTHVSRGRNSSK